MSIDWNYDFYAHGWDRGGGLNPDHITDCIRNLRLLERGGYEATTDGGWPRVGWGAVRDTDMMTTRRGGRAEPHFLHEGRYNSAWFPWYMLTSVRKVQEVE